MSDGIPSRATYCPVCLKTTRYLRLENRVLQCQDCNHRKEEALLPELSALDVVDQPRRVRCRYCDTVHKGPCPL